MQSNFLFRSGIDRLLTKVIDLIDIEAFGLGYKPSFCCFEASSRRLCAARVWFCITIWMPKLRPKARCCVSIQ